jgi:hypothetical protein
VSRDGKGKVDVGLAENVRGIVVRHELADQRTVRHDRKKRESRDTLGLDDRFERFWWISCFHVGDANGDRVLDIARPWRVPFDSAPIRVGQAAPSDKAHDAGSVEEEDSGPAAPQPPGNRIERSFVDLFESACAIEPVRERIHLLGALAFRNVHHDVDGPDLRSTLPQPHGGLIERGDPPLSVRRIDCHRECLEKFLGEALSLPKREGESYRRKLVTDRIGKAAYRGVA